MARRSPHFALFTASIVLALLLHHAAAVLDVVAELYALEQRSIDANATTLTLPHMPAALLRRLSDHSLRWEDLSSYVQRALLWDLGLVLSADGQLVQVFVPCGKSMLQVFLSKDVFDPQQCTLLACNPKNMRFAGSSCSQLAVAQLAQCAIEDNVTVASSSALWSEDGGLSSTPDIRLFRAPPSSNTTVPLYTIHQDALRLRSPRDCPSKPTFIAPCTRRTMENAGDWCVPTTGGFVDVWLTRMQAMEGTSSPHVVSTTTMALVVFCSAVVVGGFLAWICVRRLQWCQPTRYLPAHYLSADLSTIAAKSDDGLLPVMPLPKRTNSWQHRVPHCALKRHPRRDRSAGRELLSRY
ncbi:hypothetical protein PINS_up010027 [Pythium insidiosum]|nr:hypothetical protein PINS_up010027 [Pythium insidiosum]